MADEPGAECSRYGSGIGGFFRDGKLFSFLEWGFDVLKKRDWERVALMEIWNVGVEAGEGVLVGKEAGVGEFPAEDCARWLVVESVG